MKLTRKQIYAAKTLAELETLAKAAGYKYGFVQAIWRAREAKAKKSLALLCLLALTACNDAAMAKCQEKYSYDTCFKQLNGGN